MNGQADRWGLRCPGGETAGSSCPGAHLLEARPPPGTHRPAQSFIQHVHAQLSKNAYLLPQRAHQRVQLHQRGLCKQCGRPRHMKGGCGGRAGAGGARALQGPWRTLGSPSSTHQWGTCCSHSAARRSRPQTGQPADRPLAQGWWPGRARPASCQPIGALISDSRAGRSATEECCDRSVCASWALQPWLCASTGASCEGSKETNNDCGTGNAAVPGVPEMVHHGGHVSAPRQHLPSATASSFATLNL